MASGKKVKVVPSEQTKVRAKKTKFAAVASGKTSAVATGRVVQQRREMKAGPKAADNGRSKRRRDLKHP